MSTQPTTSADIFPAKGGEESPISLEDQVQTTFNEIKQQCPNSDGVFPILGGTRPNCYVRDGHPLYITYTELTMDLTNPQEVAEIGTRLQREPNDHTAGRISLALLPLYYNPSILLLTGNHIINDEILEVGCQSVLTPENPDYQVALNYLLELADRYIGLSEAVAVLRNPVIVAG